MARSGRILRKTAICTVAALMVGSFTAAQLLSFGGKGRESAPVASAQTGETVTDLTGKVASELTSSFDPEVVRKLPEGIDAGREISVLVRTSDTALVSAYDAQNGVSRYGTVSAFADSSAGEAVIGRIDRANKQAISRLRNAGVDFELGATYNTVLGGFELIVKAEEYEKIVTALDGTDAIPSVSEEYAPAEAQLVENDVNVYDTGIFDSSDLPLKGEGTLIAVLDTGFDYTHSVYDPEVFARDVDGSKLFMTRERLDGVIGELRAADFTRGLSSEKVFINDKIPYAYDYADRDTDVYPLDSEHGTHVGGIILGNNVGSTKNNEGDPAIVGVAPLAQLAAMKVFSDTTQGARQTWIIAALEDCVKLGVDVVNMSLGMSAGFTVADDPAQNAVYDNVGKAGISLVAAASNDYNSTFGSAKNGNLGLTSNPDSATVGSPSTYSSALSVASISGVKTSYIKYGKRIIYFNEASDAASEPMDFVDELLSQYGVDSKEFEYVTVPGIGAYADYMGLDVAGKIALVRRGNNSFEEKARVAIEDMHAAGVIIYNNVSGDISMTVGGTKGAICSISQDDGEILAKNRTGKITISRKQVAGPFMSDFSSWGPTPDLRIKPEITAHGGDILSAVPGQRYDRLSGTSMASPNQAGVTAILREYVKETFDLTGEDAATRQEVAARVNQIMMSTADIAYNTDALPYAVRKQGAGLANLTKALETPAYITTYERNDEHLYDGSPRFIVDADHVMDKAKLEYGDDRDRTGVYDLVFTVNNISDKALTYKIGALVQTEGVSETLTVRGDTTVTEKGYALSPKVTVTDVNGTAHRGASVTVAAKGRATVTVRIELSDSDKQYLERSFRNGMFVEGFITLKASSGTKIDLNVPFLAFYGDWTQAPIFDLDYFETNPDELDNGIDQDDKKMPDAYATQPIGSMYSDYIMYLGSYPFTQDPSSSRQVAATREHIALTNQQNENGVNSIYAVWAGMLRAAKHVYITITDTTTGEVIWSKTETNIRKTYSSGSNFYNSTVDIDFSVPEHDLKNNTKYMVRLESYLDYGEESEQNNERNVFEFPFVTDFQAPAITGVEFYTEVDRSNRDMPKTRTYARISVYDNHYAAGAFFGYMRYNTDPDSPYLYEMPGFTNYATPINAASINSTTDVTLELTDYLEDIANAVNPNTFTVQLFDYALNISTFEIKVPDDVAKVHFSGANVKTEEDGAQTITLNPNEKYLLSPEVYPTSAWAGTLKYEIEDESIAKIVGGTLIGMKSGDSKLFVYSSAAVEAETRDPLTTVNVHVLGEGEEGYKPKDSAGISVFRLTRYRTDKAFYFLNSSDRSIGETGSDTLFAANAPEGGYYLSMYPSEEITLFYELQSFEDGVEVRFSSGNERIASITEDGHITALRQGSVTIEVNAMLNDYAVSSAYVRINVKDPYDRNGPFLTGYRGLGQIGEDGVPTGVVDIEKDLGSMHGITTIEQFAFSHYDYIPKGPDDIIDEEDPYNNKIWYLGENDHITEVIIPEGVTDINMYAFAGMEGLKRVVLPSTLKHIGMGAFLGCTSLTEVVGLGNVQLINQDAFRNSGLESADLSSVIAIGNYAFANTKLGGQLELPASAQSIGAYAFANNGDIDRLVIRARTVKLGEGAFSNDQRLTVIPTINAANIPEGLFNGDKNLTSVTIGPDVESIDRNAFRGTGIAEFFVDKENKVFEASEDHKSLFRIGDEKELLCVVPTYAGAYTDVNNTITKVGAGAFSGLNLLTSVNLPNVTEIGESAFYDCPRLTSVKLGDVENIPEYAFFDSPITSFNFNSVKNIGAYSFCGTGLGTIQLPDDVVVGTRAFMGITTLRSVKIGHRAVIGDYAFANTAWYGSTRSYNVRISGGEVIVLHEVGYVIDRNVLASVTAANDVVIGSYAFAFNGLLGNITLGTGVTIGDHAFYICTGLATADLSGVTSIGTEAFAGATTGIAEVDAESGGYDFWETNHGVQANRLTSVDLTNLTSIGESAFSLNTALKQVRLGEGLKTIAPYAFYGTRIETIGLGNVETVGAYAFASHTSEIFFDNETETTYAMAASSVDLSHAVNIGAHAFENAQSLTTVTLPAPAAEETPSAPAALVQTAIGDYAFAGDTALTAAEHLENVYAIGAHAFEHTALSGKIDLSGVIAIGDLAFAYNALEEVVLGSSLLDIGDNPFAGNPMKPFGSYTNVYFPSDSTRPEDIVDTVFNGNFDISDAVVAIDGVLYRKREFAGGDLRGVRGGQYYLYGLELISYPATAEAKEYTVEEGTVRIAAGAFMDAKLERVYLPESLAAIGDKAFFGATALDTVVFRSLKAPILEEQYDESYQISGGDDSSLPGPYLQNDINDYAYSDLGILKYGMWFVDATSYFYGANFVNYVGKVTDKLNMVRPANGTGYENFIYGQYFDRVFDGAVAADDTTRSVVRAITLLTDLSELTESNWKEILPSVQAARALYDTIATDAQRALVGNYEKLRDLEEKLNQLSGASSVEPEAPTTENGSGITTIALAVVCGVLGAAVIVMAALLLSRKGKGTAAAGGDAGDEDRDQD